MLAKFSNESAPPLFEGAMDQTVSQSQPEDLIDANALDFAFTKEVQGRSGVNLNSCWHCLCCTGGCPFFHAMDLAPNAVIRLVQLGLKDEALRCSTIWICVGCHTCSSECPQAIDMSAIMDTLRQMAIEEGVPVAEPDILKFHDEVLKSIDRHGRTHKLEIMLRYKARKLDLFSDINVGLRMLAKRKLDLKPSKVRDIEKIHHLFATDVSNEASP
jgi:heterodisulfide reductase subunit C